MKNLLESKGIKVSVHK